MCVVCIGWTNKLVLPWHGHFQRRPGWQVKSKSGTHPEKNKRTVITLPRQHWHSFNIPVDAVLVQLRGLIWTQVECNMDSTFPPCDSLAQGRFVAKTKEQKQELFHFLQQAPRQCIGTMDTRLCPVYMLALTNERQKENSLCVDSVTLKLLNLQWQL